MSKMPTTILGDKHPYTRLSVPWEMDDPKAENLYGRLLRYLSGGGMRTFGRTANQQRARRRQRRFALYVGIYAVLWLLLCLC